ncbi:hypothetical protein GW17_00038305 [Ensete ventricosum]|nr:hypothetical protein GW17_00038305 [Ensete ventricosum]
MVCQIKHGSNMTGRKHQSNTRNLQTLLTIKDMILLAVTDFSNRTRNLDNKDVLVFPNSFFTWYQSKSLYKRDYSFFFFFHYPATVLSLLDSDRNPFASYGRSSSVASSHSKDHRRSHITASRSLTTPRTLAKAPSAVRLRVRCDLTDIPVLSFFGERVGAIPLDLKSAPSETACAVVHHGLVAKQQNQRRGTASILTVAASPATQLLPSPSVATLLAVDLPCCS